MVVITRVFVINGAKVCEKQVRRIHVLIPHLTQLSIDGLAQTSKLMTDWLKLLSL